MFLLFCGFHYYPSGGWKDFKGLYFTLESAIEAAANVSDADWWHVSDGQIIVAQGRRA